MRQSKFLAALLLAAGTASASQITVTIQVDLNSAYDYVTATYVSIPPISGLVSLTFNGSQRSFIDYGTTTITTLGGTMGTNWTSPVTGFIPNSPYSGAYGSFYNSYTFPNVSDYSSQFIEEAASQANTYQVVAGQYSYYHIEVRATKRTPPSNADGTSDYAFTENQLIDFYREFQATGAPVYFNESYAVYTLPSGSAVYSEGKSWSSYTARIVDVQVSAVPEAQSVLMFCFGLLPIAVAAKRRRPTAERDLTPRSS